MGSRGGNGRGSGGGGAAVSGIPAASRKVVQSLKEIVNCPEHEIYAMLKECNMDPNEAINRLLTQDPFHEVKSKREKKKENKDTADSRPRGINNTSTRGNKGSIDRGRGAPTQFNSFDSGATYVKPAYKKDNGQSSYSSSFSASGMAGNSSRQPPFLSDFAPPEDKISAIADGISSSSQPSSGVQSAWLGVPGQVSMADIVKKGRPHGNASSTPNRSQQNVHDHHVLTPLPAASHHDFHLPQDHTSKVSELNPESGVAKSTLVPPNDEWPLVEQPPAPSVSSVLEAVADSELYAESSEFTIDRTNQHQVDEVRVEQDDNAEQFNSNHVGPATLSSLNIHRESPGASPSDNDLYQKNTFETREEDAAIAAEKFQQLSLQDNQHAESEEDRHPVKIPNHLQVQTEHFSHLSFGSFGAGISAQIAGPCASRPPQNEEASSAADASSVGLSDTRNYEYYGDEHLRTVSDGNIAHISDASAGIYDSPSVSQPEGLKPESSEAVQGNQYTFPSSGYNFESAEHMNPALSHPQSSAQMPNHDPFSNAMVYTNSLPSALLASNMQPVREPDLAYSPFSMTQSMPPKYNTTMSSISGPTISMPEALKVGNFSSPLPTAQTSTGTTVATGPALPQHHLAVHPYSQPTLPLGHFANMIGYPFLPPQSYTYLPSAFQQAFTGSSYHQSLAAVLPQYKNSVSVSSLPQSGYGAFGSSSSIPGSFSLNPPAAAPTGTTLGYDDIISSHYKAANPLISVPQNENTGMWLHGLGSRTMSAVPPSTYYNHHQGHNQQAAAAGYRQVQQQQQPQQPTQHVGPLGYPNFYHSQGGGISLEHQQNPRDGALGGSQTQQSKQSQQIWQNSY